MASSCREIFNGLHGSRGRRGHRVALTGREEIGGVNYYLFSSLWPTAMSRRSTSIAKSWSVTRRRDVRALHVDIDPTPTTIEQQMSGFRRVAGVLFPFANTETDLENRQGP